MSQTCERCGKKTDFLHGLGNCHNKGNPIIKVCKKCCTEWIKFLDAYLVKKTIAEPFLNLEEDIKDKLWLEAFKKWNVKFNVRFTFR